MTLTARPPLSIEAVEAKRIRLVKGFAVAGALFVALWVYLFSAWILSGDARPTPKGPTPIPTWMRISVHSWEALSCIFLVACVVLLLVRPWRRQRRLTIDGMLCLACLSMMWQDTLVNYFQPWVTINAELVNFGSWNLHIPGWMSPRGNFIVEPVLFDMPAYVWFVVPAAIIGCRLMAAIKRRWPSLGTVSVVAITYLFFIAFDAVAEPLFLVFGVYSYPGAIQSVSVFPGRYFQFPLYEAFLWGGTWTALTCLRYFRNDRGETVVERGIQELRVGQSWKTPIRVLALAGACNLIFLVTYNVPAAIMGLHSDAWPNDVVKRSYLTDNLCGPGTPYHCPGPAVPIPRRESTHLAPDGGMTRP